MFDSDLFFKLCVEYGVEIIDNSTNPGLFLETDDGEIIPLTSDLVDFIIGEPISH